MDLLYQRYASPFSFMDGMIQTGRFVEFVVNLVETVNKEKSDDSAWDFYLHKVWDNITFADFKADLENNIKNQTMSEQSIETTVQNSMNILKNFNPEQGGE